MHQVFKYIIYTFLFSYSVSCNKIVKIPQPINSITSDKSFGSDANATAAIVGIYSDMTIGAGNTSAIPSFANSLTTICAGLSADEFNDIGYYFPQYQNNTILSNDANIAVQFWQGPYYDIYMANAAIEGLEASTSITATVKKQLIGEAKFLRAFCHFYLVNLFGDIPLVTTSDWQKIRLLPRSPTATVYQQIIDDLHDAQNRLGTNYVAANGEKIRANKWSATALLARAYLYTSNWQGADSAATAVINSGDYSLMGDPNQAFLKNSNEAILQLQPISNDYYATAEGNFLIPTDLTIQPLESLTDSLLAAFEPNDLRRASWVDSSGSPGAYYYFPFKYKVQIGNPGAISEYYMVLRYAEQFLVRAEARAHENTNLTAAIADLDNIRTRASLPDLSPFLGQAEVLAAVAQERRVELFAEWGHRWLDLKRTGRANIVLSYKPGWNNNGLLFPIPSAELLVDPNLKQNPGYQ